MTDTQTLPDVRAYLEIRTSAPSGWSPDGRRLLVSSNLPGTAQVHRLDLDAHQLPVRVEDLPAVTRFAEPIGAGYLPAHPRGGAGDVLLLATDAGGNERHQLYTAGADPAEPYAEVDDLDPLVVDLDFIHRPGGVTRDGRRLAYATNRGDGVAFDTWVRDLTTGEERCVLATGGWTGPGGFSPDGRYLAVTEVTTRPGDNRVLLVDLHALPSEGPVGVDHPAVVELLPHDELDPSAVGTPSWLPDGSAFVLSADVGRDHAALWWGRTADDGRGRFTVDLEPAVETGWSTGGAFDWSGTHLLVTWNEGGITRAELRDPDSLEVRGPVPMPGDGVAGGFQFTRDGRYLAFSYSSALVPGDCWSFDTATGELTRLTVSPCGVDQAAFVDAEVVAFPSFDGLEIPAFLHRPAPDPSGRPAPVVVVIHGGPESQHRPSFNPLTQYLVASGFAVVAPNVRGSTGYGKRYQHLDDVDKRLDSIADLAALHAWLQTRPDLDHTRAALYGGSYGGYMVLAGLAFQPELWAAGVDVVGMSDLVTFLQNTSSWRRAFREREYGSLEDDRDVLEAASPINRVDQMTAPLLIIHGANDPRVPLSEAQQIHEVLTARAVRCDLLVYEDEGHGLAKLVNRIDAYPKVTAFLHDVLDR